MSQRILDLKWKIKIILVCNIMIITMIFLLFATYVQSFGCDDNDGCIILGKVGGEEHLIGDNK